MSRRLLDRCLCDHFSILLGFIFCRPPHFISLKVKTTFTATSTLFLFLLGTEYTIFSVTMHGPRPHNLAFRYVPPYSVLPIENAALRRQHHRFIIFIFGRNWLLFGRIRGLALHALILPQLGRPGVKYNHHHDHHPFYMGRYFVRLRSTGELVSYSARIPTCLRDFMIGTE